MRSKTSLTIKPEWIDLAKKRGACKEALKWLRSGNHTLAELYKENILWAGWSAMHVDLPSDAKQELFELTGMKTFFDDDGERHRIGGPAVEYAYGAKEWYEHGQLHRIGGPAIEYTGGTKEWYEHGQRHRIGGPAIEWVGGMKEWYERGKFIRREGP